ncbi:Ger(x)C family spore germination protein [Bacillus toyonensis]|uniref:Spore germination protein n=1 Tax=Bacillus toyonensis TaxID=155322 RepID=A0A2A8H7U5_9BACI|nr:Ger(x)C family spore germination protein [Bacillus toyonensis]PEP93141.1 spore germination protein [Bacillus toyonensis]
MKINRKGGLFLLMFLFLLTGCWDRRELEHVLFINTLGIDFKDNHYIIYPQFINFTNMAKEEGTASRNYSPVYIGKGEGEILYDTVFDFYKSTQQQVSWEHIKSIVVTERFLKNGNLNQLNDFLSRFFQFRNTMWVFGTTEPLENILATNNIFNISSLYTLMNLPQEMIRQYASVDPLRLYTFRSNYYEPGMTTRIPFLATTTKHWRKGHKPFRMLEFNGYGCIAAKSYVNHLNDSNIAGVRWTNKNTNRAPLLLKFKNQAIGGITLKNPKIDTKFSIEKGKPHIVMNIRLEGDMYQVMKSMPIHKAKKIAENLVEKEIRMTYQKGMEKGIDVYQLSHLLYRDQLTLWKKYQKKGMIPLQSNTLDLKVSIHISTNGKSKVTGSVAKFEKSLHE